MNNFAIVKLVAFGTTASLLLFCPGCATTSQPAPPRPDYSGVPLMPGVFRVVHRNGDSVSADRNLDLTLLEACQLAQARGFSHFAVIDEEASTTGQTVYYAGLNHLVFKPSSGLVIRCFSSKPKRVFIFQSSKLRKILEEKLNLNP